MRKLSHYEYLEIREHYKRLLPVIIERKNAWADPYCHINWEGIFSPIEKQMWEAIRIFGRTPMYPQYPVLNYFVDFGNPFKKVAIECDGKNFHLDKEKDFIRDYELFRDGWTIYRVTGADCYTDVDREFWNLDLIERKEMRDTIVDDYYETVEGLLKAISVRHFNNKDISDDIKEIHKVYRTVIRKISIICKPGLKK